MFPCSLRYFANVPLFPKTPGRPSFTYCVSTNRVRRSEKLRGDLRDSWQRWRANVVVCKTSFHFQFILFTLTEKCVDKVGTSTCTWRVQNGHRCSVAYMKLDCVKTCVCGTSYLSAPTSDKNATFLSVVVIVLQHREHRSQTLVRLPRL